MLTGFRVRDRRRAWPSERQPRAPHTLRHVRAARGVPGRALLRMARCASRVRIPRVRTPRVRILRVRVRNTTRAG